MGLCGFNSQRRSVYQAQRLRKRKKRTSERYFIFLSDDESGAPRRSFVTDVDVAGSRAWYNTVKMAVFTSFVTAATVRDDEIHKQPPIVDLHIQMVFFYFCDASIATPRAIFRHDKHQHVARRAISYNNNTTHIHAQTPIIHASAHGRITPLFAKRRDFFALSTRSNRRWCAIGTSNIKTPVYTQQNAFRARVRACESLGYSAYFPGLQFLRGAASAVKSLKSMKRKTSGRSFVPHRRDVNSQL